MILVNDRDQLEWHEGMTVQDILDEMNYTYSMIVVGLNEQIIHEVDYHTTLVEDNSKVTVFHLAHGG
ncbi:MAG: sulfur carrier protein ThiS [Clostridia bacterium]|nr:sulfur carrier protein ThiS [Clostridia bacterium]